MSIREASELFNVGTVTISRARQVRRHGIPELVSAVEHGEIAVYPAAKIAQLPSPEQRTAVAAPRASSRRSDTTTAQGAMDRVQRTVDSMTNLAEVLDEALPQMNGDARRPTWAAGLRRVRTTLTRFIAECEHE